MGVGMSDGYYAFPNQTNDLITNVERCGWTLELKLGEDLTIDDCRRLLADGQIDAGLAALEKLAAAPHPDPALIWLLGETYRSVGRPRAAADVYYRLVGREPRSVAFRMALADALAAADSVGEAIEVARAAVALSPRDVRARLLLVDTLGRADLFEEALTVAEEARTIAPEDVQICLRIARARFALGHADEASRAFERALLLSPGLLEARVGLGRLALRRGRLQRAIELLGEALAETPDDHRLRLDLCAALRRADLFEEARRLLSPEVVGPDAPDAIRAEAGRLMLATGHWAGGRDDFDCRTLFPPSDRPRWDGRRAPAERLLVVVEAGECDTLAFGRLLPALASEVMSVTLAAGAAQLATLEAVPGILGPTPLVDIADPPPHDMWLPLASLPVVLGVKPHEVPPPLLPRTTVIERRGVPVIGLALNPSPWSPVAEPAAGDVVTALRSAFPMARFVALDDEAARWLGGGIAGDLPATIRGVDLVVATDGPVAHLTGTLGLPLWLLLDCAAHWMWGREGRLSRWYPSARLFRANGPAWQGVAEALLAEAMALATPGLTDVAALRRLADAAGGVGGDAAAHTALPFASRLAALLPADPAATSLFASLLLRLGEDVDADRALAAALATTPRHAPLLLLAARREIERGDAPAALRHAELALAIDAGSVEALMMRASVLSELGEAAKAEFALRQAVQKAPCRADLLVAWGETLRRLGDNRAAARAFERAITAEDRADARLGLGRLAALSGETGLALHFLNRAIALDPGDVEVSIELALALRAVRRTPDAVAVLRALLKLRGGAASAHALLGELLMAAGDFPAGTREFEWRHGHAPAALPQPDDFVGRPVVLLAEGDTGALIRLLRYAPLIREAGATSLRLAGAGAMELLLTWFPGVDGPGEPATGDLVIPVLSLPAIFATVATDLPRADRCLRPSPEAVTDAAMHLAGLTGFRVGVALGGTDAAVSLPTLAGVTWIALDAEARARLPDAKGLKADGLADVAAAVLNLDAIVVSAASPVAAVAGALGRPVFAFGPDADDWLWLERGGRTPWFAATRLFPRRTGETDGGGQASRLAEALAAFAGGDRTIPFAASPDESDAGDNSVERPFSAAALAEAGLRALDRRDDHRAILLLADSIAAGNDDRMLREKLAAALIRVGDRDRAGQILASLTAEAPTAERLADLADIDRLGGRLSEALAHAERAVALRPDLARAHRAVGKVCLALGRVDEALASFGRAVALTPADPELLADEAEALLAAGDYRRGFARFEIRWQAAEFLPRRFDVPRWAGEEIGGKTLLVHGEQGLGAQIAFARFLPQLVRSGARLVVEVRPALIDLFRSLDLGGDVTVVEQGRRLPQHDLEVPLLSLPHVLSVERGNLPPPARFLPDPLRVEAWNRLIGGEQRTVGLYWRNADDLAPCAPLFDLSDIRLMALDRQGGRATAAALPAGAKITSLGDRLFGFAETAAVLSTLDLVVAPASATAHLAASLGRPTVVIDPAPSDWLWSGPGASPWYPEAVLLRRTEGEIGPRLREAVLERLLP